MSKFEILWSDQAQESLRKIFEFYKERSVQGARNVKNDLLSAPRKLQYSRQYQIDDVYPKYRRIIVRDYKILYRE